ncbi:hypothetical protein V3C99_013535, partial [Haemonchus contortus]
WKTVKDWKQMKFRTVCQYTPNPLTFAIVRWEVELVQ